MAVNLFNEQWYLDQNPDVAAAVAAGLTTAYQHFMAYGQYESRAPSALFDPAFYLNQNPDVAAAVAAGLASAYEHFLLYGQSEPRTISPFIDLAAYANANPDLAAVEGLNLYQHLVTYGLHENRDLGNGITLGQFANDPVFNAALADPGHILDALARIAEVAPFLPDFQPPEGWTPPADTPIPTDFVPPEGLLLVVPPSIIVPEGTELPDTFQPVDNDSGGGGGTGGGGGGGGGGPAATFMVTESAGVVTFANAGSTISATVSGDTITFTSNSQTDTATLSTTNEIQVGSGITLSGSAALFDGITVKGLGNLTFTGNSTVDDIAGITFAEVTGTVTYNLSDTAAHLAAAGATGNGAANVVATDAATVAEALAIVALTNSGTTTYSISDSAAAIAAQLGADATVITNATSTATNDLAAIDLSVEQAGALTGAGVTITNGYNISDTAAHLAAAGATGNGAANVVATDAATVAEALAIAALSNTGTKTYSINDTAALIDDADASVLNGATAITATGTEGVDTIDLSNNANGPLTVGVTINLLGGDDTFVGGSGDDTITGGAGADILTGGLGNNTFVFAAGDSGLPTAVNFDTILDWTAGTNVINFGATALTIDDSTGLNPDVGATAGTGLYGVADYANLAVFVADLANSTTTTAGSTLAYDNGTHTYLFISDGVAGLGANDVLVQLTGVTGLTTGATIVDGDITGFA